MMNMFSSCWPYVHSVLLWLVNSNNSRNEGEVAATVTSNSNSNSTTSASIIPNNVNLATSTVNHGSNSSSNGAMNPVVNTIDMNLNAKESRFGTTPFHAASLNGHTEIVELLSNDKRIHLNMCDNLGRTAFYMAC